MMTLIELTEVITAKLGKSDAASQSRCKEYIRARYRMIYDMMLWRDSLGMVATSATTVAAVVLPNQFERVVAVRLDQERAFPVEQQWLVGVDPAAFERTGPPILFWELSPVAVRPLPTAATTLTLVSDNTADTGIDMIIRGELAGVEQKETVTLNGTTAVVSANSYDTPTLIGKPVTAGTITVKNSGGTTISTIWPEERTRQYTRIQLNPTPTASVNVSILAKKKLRDLTDDNDSPILRNIDNALIAFGIADMLERERQYGKAQLKIQEGMAQVQTMKDVDQQQSATAIQLVPATSGEWTRDDFEQGYFSKSNPLGFP